jgi:hypothetical protein
MGGALPWHLLVRKPPFPAVLAAGCIFISHPSARLKYCSAALDQNTWRLQARLQSGWAAGAFVELKPTSKSLQVPHMQGAGEVASPGCGRHGHRSCPNLWALHDQEGPLPPGEHLGCSSWVWGEAPMDRRVLRIEETPVSETR